jgi:uncharacterized protein DUF1707
VDCSRHVSDLEREEAVAALREDLLAGRLTLDEFSERVDIAYRARVGADLARARQALPGAAPSPARPPGRRSRVTAALFGHVVRRGRLRLPARTLVVSAFGDVDLDLRDAQIDEPRVTVTLLVGVGNVDVYVPEGIVVELGGALVFGRRRDWGRDTARADAPTVHVRAVGCVGTVDVWRVPRDMRGDYGEIMEQLEERQRGLARGTT